jgi:hypothetical protein
MTMKLYIAAGQYVGTQAEAKKLDRDFTTVEVPVDKPGLIAYLNQYQIDRDLHHQRVEDDGTHVVKDINEDVHPERAPSYTEVSVGGDDWFAGIPVEHQLTLTQNALENARTEIIRLKGAERGGVAKPADVELDPFA